MEGQSCFPCRLIGKMVFSVIVLFCSVEWTNAAQIRVDLTTEVPRVFISGPIVLEDGDAFASKVTGLARAVVEMDSLGGNLYAGLRIGTLIHLKNFATAVPNGYVCASACAFAWLGGSVRMMGPAGLVGFHAAYLVKNGQQIETGVGNALVGAYLDRLGLSFDAIAFITSAAPSDINWLTPDAAQTLGINVSLLIPDRQPTTSSVAPALAEPSPHSRGDLDELARSFVASYFAHWSDNNANALAYFSDVYGDKINFFDRPISRQILLSEKRKYADHWPERIYTVRPSTIKTDCHLNELSCTVTGQVEYDCRNPNESLQSTGLANFTLQIAVTNRDVVKINGEWSSVVSRHD